jgi:hypothetical protein
LTRIRGIPGLPEPTFRTADGAWASLDSVVTRVCEVLHDDVSPLVAKGVIQVARDALRRDDPVDIGRVATVVSLALRAEHIVVTPPVVQGVLMAYARVYAALEVVQVVEG